MLRNIYNVINKPWVHVPNLLRARRFQKFRTALNDREHTYWAQKLNSR